MGQISEAVIKVVIENDYEPIRFERFCSALLGDIEGGAEILPTSRSWDLGRDGRANTRTGDIYVCCSLTNTVDKKIQADLKKLCSSLLKKSRIYFCSSQPLSEHKCNELETQLRQQINDHEIVIYGSIQLVAFAGKHSGLIDNFYKSELADVLALLVNSNTAFEDDNESLRLALISTGKEDTRAIRNEIYHTIILESLSDEKPKTVGECAVIVASALRLNRSLPNECLLSYFQSLVEEKQIMSIDGVKFQITAAGKEEIEASKIVAGNALLSGRNEIRNAIETEIGHKLSENHYNQIWTCLIEHLSDAFYRRGQKMVMAVSEILGNVNVSKGENGNLTGFELLQNIADAVASTSNFYDQQEELKTAVIDIFTTPTGQAFEWLVKMCTAYVSICSMGLEANSARELSKLVSNITLIFDTDVILSLLNKGEPDFDSVNAIQKRWVALGGTIMVGNSVLQEAAYHAWISEHDFQEVKNWLPGPTADRLRLIDNSFVRGFAEKVSLNQARLSQWPKYIQMYRGQEKYDSRPIVETLKHDYNINEMPSLNTTDNNLEQKVREFLQSQVRANHKHGNLNNKMDKVSRDAELYASIVNYHRLKINESSVNTCLLVSSARRLSDVEKKFKEVNEAHLVVSISNIMYMLSMIPNVTFGLSAMKAFLFDEKVNRFSSRLERQLMRVIKESSQMDMPFAKRHFLMREVRKQIVDDARSSGEPIRTERDRSFAEKKAMSIENLPRTVEILKYALDELAVKSANDIEKSGMAKTISDLEQQVQDLRSKLQVKDRKKK